MRQWANRRDWPAITAFWVGAVLFLLVYGSAPLNPAYDSWIFGGYIGVDVLQHYAGWAAFRAGPWGWPLTFTPLLGWPFGGAAALADCVPLFALPAKLLSPLVGGSWQYFGWFCLFCMAMSGYAGAKLLGAFGLPATGRVLGSALFAASPILLERAFQHTALAAHFLVVLGLYVYFKPANRQAGCAVAQPGPDGAGAVAPPGRACRCLGLWAYVPLCAVAAATHVYFVPMVLALAFAAAVRAVAPGWHWRRGLFLPASALAAVLVAWALGFFSAAEYVPGGYGQFGMNLNAFWNPASWNWATWDTSYQNLHWSRVLPMLPVVGDSLGSFAYLGLGVLLGLGAAVAAVLLWARGLVGRHGGRGLWRAVRGLLRRHAGLLVALLCLGLFAISNVVTANSRTLFVVPLPDFIIRLCDMFRSSGRLIWPVYYLLVALAVWGVARLGRSLGRWLAKRQGRQAGRPLCVAAVAVALCLLLVVQGADLSAVLAQKHAFFARPVVSQSALPPQNWDAIAAPGRVLYQLELNEDRPMALHAALAGMPSNYYLLARGTPGALAQDMAATRAALLAGQLPHPGQAIVYLTRDAELAGQLTAALKGRCQVLPCGSYTAFLPL